MALITFEDLPSTNTPLNANNLNNNFAECNNIIESGSNANGNYIKYNDGTMICYADKVSTVNTSSSVDGVYYTSVTMAFPETFTAVPTIVTSVTQTTGLVLNTLGNSQPTTTSVQIRIVTMTQKTNLVVGTRYIAIGKWQ